MLKSWHLLVRSSLLLVTISLGTLFCFFVFMSVLFFVGTCWWDPPCYWWRCLLWHFFIFLFLSVLFFCWYLLVRSSLLLVTMSLVTLCWAVNAQGHGQSLVIEQWQSKDDDNNGNEMVMMAWKIWGQWIEKYLERVARWEQRRRSKGKQELSIRKSENFKF